MNDLKLLDVQALEKTYDVTLENGDIIKCHRISIDTLDKISGGLKKIEKAASLLAVPAAFIGKTPLYKPNGNVSTYMKSKSGNTLSSSIGSGGKINGQPGFSPSGITIDGFVLSITCASIAAIAAVAGFIIDDYISPIKQLDEIYGEIEKNYNSLCRIKEDYNYYFTDETYRGANIIKINNILDDEKNRFRKLYLKAQRERKISEKLITTMRASLEVYSFACFLKVAYSKIDDIASALKKEKSNIEKAMKLYNEIYDKCYSFYYSKYEKSNRASSTNIFNVLLLFAPKTAEKCHSIITNLDKYKCVENQFLNQIDAGLKTLDSKKIVLRDDKYLYIEADDKSFKSK